MKHSLRIRLVIIFTGTLIFSVILIWCMNRFMLNSYYESSKISQMEDVNSSVGGLCKDIKWGSFSEQDSANLSHVLYSLSANSGVNIYVAAVFIDEVFLKYPTQMDEWQFVDMKDRLIYYINLERGNFKPDSNCQLLFESENYKMYKVYDERVGSNYIESISKLNNVTWIYLRTNYQNMQESANVSNRLLTYVGSIVILVGIFVMYFVSNSYTKPIMHLVEHAKKMSQLDFNARYEEDRIDEIGILGNTMNALSDKLEQTISELKTANNELQVDIARKQEQEEMRTEFLANVSHELKTPIALIQGYAEGLLDNINEDAESRDFYCEVIIDEADKMNKMVKKLLSLNQLEFGNGQVHMERFDIVESIQSIMAANELFIKQKGVVLNFTPNGAIDVWADEYMVDEVITNYVSNALNHVSFPLGDETKERLIEVKLVKEEKRVRVSVFNTGKPIPDEDIERIWDKFYKVDKARTREYGGNGIGLSIVKAVMEAHNQSYGVNNYDNGVEFWFELACV